MFIKLFQSVVIQQKYIIVNYNNSNSFQLLFMIIINCDITSDVIIIDDNETELQLNMLLQFHESYQQFMFDERI